MPELEATSAQMTMMVNVRKHAFSVPPGGTAELGTLADADRSRTRQLPLSAVSDSSYKSETFAFSHTFMVSVDVKHHVYLLQPHTVSRFGLAVRR